jgi:hypothetical protein
VTPVVGVRLWLREPAHLIASYIYKVFQHPWLAVIRMQPSTDIKIKSLTKLSKLLI